MQSYAHVTSEDTQVKSQPDELHKEACAVFDAVSEEKEKRDQPHPYFRGEALDTYSTASIMQFVGHRPKPEYKKDYQYNIFEPITRDKVMAIISKGSGLYEAEFFNTNKKLNGVSQTLATVMGAFYADSRYTLNDVDNNKALMLEALITPKAIWYEGWRFQKRTVCDVIDRDEEGRPTYSKKQIVHYNGPWGQVVPVEEFIPGSMKIRDIQEQPALSWITRMNYSEFQRTFNTKRYPWAKYVRPYKFLFDQGLTELIVDTTKMTDNDVEVVYRFDKWNDKLSIVASGTLLTGIDDPMPFAHKDYPFAWAGFEPFRSNFVYDMPLPMKILDMQDMNNENFNLALDMTWRALNEIILVGAEDGINEDVIYGGGMANVNDPRNFQKMEFGSAFGFQAAGNVMDRARRAIESASLDAPSSGTSGNAPRTAREVLVAKEAAMEITSLFIQNLESLEAQKALLRVQNQLDRYQRPTEWQDAIGEDLAKKAIPVFREISARDTRLDNGKRGTATIRITETPRPGKELNEVNSEDKTEMSQTIDVSPELIRMIKPMVRIVPNSSVKKSKALETAESRQYFGDAMAAPEIFNVKEAARDYVEKLGKNPDDALVKEQEQPADPMAALMGGGAKKPGEPTKSPIQPMNDSIEGLLNVGV